jgi:hypothetical protein
MRRRPCAVPCKHVGIDRKSDAGLCTPKAPLNPHDIRAFAIHWLAWAAGGDIGNANILGRSRPSQTTRRSDEAAYPSRCRIRASCGACFSKCRVVAVGALSMERALIKLRACCEKLGRISSGVQLGSIINDPCPIGFVILRIQATNKKNDQFMEVIICCRTSPCARILDGRSNGTIEVLTAERFRFRRQAERNGCEDRN